MVRRPSFEIIPPTSELGERELRFVSPDRSRSPRRLTPDDVDRFDRDGYLAGIRALDPDEADRLRGYFDALLAETLASGGTSYSISSAHLSHGRVYDLMRDERIVDVVADLLGPDVVGWGAHFFCKMPGDGKTVSFHQDASYWPLSPARTVTVWLAVDASDEENGAMEVIPGSHRHGAIPFERSDANEDNVLDQTVPNAERFGQPVPIKLAAGEISVHSDLLLHGSGANRSRRRRCGLTLRYCPPCVRAGRGWNAKGILVEGGDPSGHWANPRRPDAN